MSEYEGDPIPWSEIVKGYEYETGKFVVLTDDDFKDMATENYRSNLMKVIKAKMTGKKIEPEEPQEEKHSGVLDLKSRLRASLEHGSARKMTRDRKSTKPRTTRRKSV